MYKIQVTALETVCNFHSRHMNNKNKTLKYEKSPSVNMNYDQENKQAK